MRATYSHFYRLIAALLCLLLMPLPTFSQGTSSSQPAGSISALVPEAYRNGATAHMKDDVMWDDVMRTAGNGRARIALKDGSILSLGSGTELKVVQHDTVTQQTQLELNYGRVRSNVMKITKPGGKFEIKTPAATAGVVGTDFAVIYEGGHMQVMVFSGVVTVTGPTGALLATVNPGQMVDLSNGIITPPHPTPPSMQTSTISQTGTGNVGGAGAGAGAGVGAGVGTSVLHTVLAVVGAVAGGTAISVASGGSSTPSPSGTPCPDCPPPLRTHHH